MASLPSDIDKLIKKARYVPGTQVPSYRLLDILASTDGDISKIANILTEIDEPSLRKAFYNMSILLKSLHQSREKTDVTPSAESQKKSTSTDIIPNALETLRQAERIKIYVDGSSKGNPGPSSYAYVFKDVKDNILLKEGAFIGDSTNNIAEARAIIAALSRALELGKRKVHLFSDSELIVCQIMGQYKIRNKGLLELHMEIRKLKSKFDIFQIVKIDRGLNKDADKFANAILLKALKQE